jgi:hypothetical protein
MAALNELAATGKASCCSAEHKASCCDPAERLDCCAPAATCGCLTTDVPAPAGDIAGRRHAL